MLQAAGADAVGALLVFLHLLERQAEGVAKLLLAHAQHHPAHADACANMLIGRIGNFLCDHWGCFSAGVNLFKWGVALAIRRVLS